MKRLVAFLRNFRILTEGFHRTSFVLILLGVVRVAMVLLFIWLSKTVIDCATGRIATSMFALIVRFGLMVACLLADVALSQLIRYIEVRTEMLMNNRISRCLFHRLMVSPLVNGKQGFHSGDMLNRLTLDVRTLSTFTITQLPSAIVMVIQIIASFAFLAWLNPYLALAPVIVMPICLLAGRLYFNRQRQLAAEIRKRESDMHVNMQEGLKHRLMFRTLEAIGVMYNRVCVIQQKLESTNRRQSRLSATSGSIVRLGFVTGYLIAFGWSIFSLRSGIITFGTMTAFIQLVSQIQRPIANIASYIPSFISTFVAVDRLCEIGSLPSEDSSLGRSADDTCEPMRNAGIRVSDVTFRYEAESEDILTSFSHDFAPGSRTMIVGSTGSGKTTLIKLLLGLLTPDSGTIEIYNNEGCVREVSPSTLCNFIYVPQGNSLVPGTIRDNLLLASPDATDDQLNRVLHIAAADFVFALPYGLDTRCDEAGGGLSEGQAQRIAIARALLREGSILLLDEFNSALDTDTAATLLKRLSEYLPAATVIIIAHHRSVIAAFCTEILPIRSEDGFHNGRNGS
ncbi:MAG: ABC transporter ATP-binding protein/permease [Muribaculaceae bacterium]|nr:ABC transporter ATP-binding protein/permease [Muribaculaceae bacterium]